MAIWDSPEANLQEMIKDVMRAATTRVGAPTAVQANLMSTALHAAGGVYGNQLNASNVEQQNRNVTDTLNANIAAGQRVAPPAPSGGMGQGVGVTPETPNIADPNAPMKKVMPASIAAAEQWLNNNDKKRIGGQ
jgi:hypothetical protein